jgi:hypothetical protein
MTRLAALGGLVLVAACGGREAGPGRPSGSTDASASNGTATSDSTSTFGPPCGQGEMLCHTCIGGTYCATDCPSLSTCPHDASAAVNAGPFDAGPFDAFGTPGICQSPAPPVGWVLTGTFCGDGGGSCPAAPGYPSTAGCYDLTVCLSTGECVACECTSSGWCCFQKPVINTGVTDAGVDAGSGSASAATSSAMSSSSVPQLSDGAVCPQGEIPCGEVCTTVSACYP